MKKQLKKLNLSKSTVSNLANGEMARIAGGDKTVNGRKCNYTNRCCMASYLEDAYFEQVKSNMR